MHAVLAISRLKYSAMKGFTLIELMIVLVIAAILVTIGVPMLTEFVADQRVRTVTSDIASEIAFARAKSIEASRRVFIQRTGATWGEGWRIFVDLDGDNAFDNGEELKIFNGFPAGNMYVCSTVADFATNVVFRPDGRAVRTTAIGANDGIYVVDTMGDAVVTNNKVRGLLFGLSGRATAVRMNGNGAAMLNRGFTLIEVLVTLVILMFGLLGIAGLMAKGQRASFEAYQRQAALAIANDMAERIRGNGAQAPAYAAGAPLAPPVGTGNQTLYDNLLANSITNCGNGNCTTAQLVTYDIAQWVGLLVGYGERQTIGATRIGGIVSAVGCVEDRTVAAAACPAPPANLGTVVPRNYTISVAWQGNEATVAPPAVDVCGTGIYSTETRRRVISLDVLILLPCP